MLRPGQAAAATITVNTTADELNVDFDCSLREAAEAANTNVAVDACAAGDVTPTVDVIDVSVTGTITLTGGQLTVTDDLKIDGPGAANLTISGNNSTRVMESSAGTALDLVDLTLANGAAVDGAGITADSSALAITNSTLSGNSATNSGGGIYQIGPGSLTITNSTLSGNSAASHGGAIIDFTASITISNSTISENSSLRGGGIYYFAPLTVDNTTFVDNTASGFPGGGGGGGAISAAGGSMDVTNTTFTGNSSGTNSGGAIQTDSGTFDVTNSTFSGNLAGCNGGGISSSTGGFTITNSTFSGNSASSEPGCDDRGGAISGVSFTLVNTIVANSPSGRNCDSTITDGGGNLQHPGTDCGASITSADPLLDPNGLQDNGGSTQTITLLDGSPAINTAVLADCPATDQRGAERPQGAGCDIGAVEVLFGYPRPAGATPVRVSLVPAYLACSSPNRIHGTPLEHGSCAPPARLSQYATVGTQEANGKPPGMTGSVRLTVLGGNPSTPPDEADVSLVTKVTDVRAAGDLSDYGGELLVAVGMRITDKLNGPSLTEPATVLDGALSWPVPCAPTANLNIGATCSTNTTADALVAGMIREGKRAVWALKQVQVADGGEDGQAATTGDNTPFLKSGVFVP